eukprot:s1711_g4.t3
MSAARTIWGRNSASLDLCGLLIHDGILPMIALPESRSELTDAVRQEIGLINQLTSRSEVLRREARALRTGSEAAKEGEARVWRKMEDVSAAELAALQREQLLQRQSLDLKENVRQLRGQLEAVQAPAVNGMDQVACELNKKLEAKVDFLRKELEREKAKYEELEMSEEGPQASQEVVGSTESSHGEQKEHLTSDLDPTP